jgi:hypothetical protein
VIRRWVAAFVSSAIPVAALCAPLVHAHPDHHDSDHHVAAVVHAHVAPHPADHHDRRRNSSESTVRDHDEEQTLRLQVYVAVGQTSYELPAATLTVVQLATPGETLAHRPVIVIHGHDPPQFPTSSRAPPSRLS